MSRIYFFSGLIISLAVFATWNITKENGELFSNLLYQRDVVFVEKGEEQSSEALSKLLPHHRSNIFWIFNLKDLAENLYTMPGLRSADVERCSWYDFRCFKIHLIRETPAYIVELSGEKWIASRDGSFIEPAKRSTEPLTGLPVIRGIHRFGSSPESISAIFPEISKGLSALERGADRRVAQVELRRNGDAAVRFTGISYPVEVSLLTADKSELIVVGERFEELRELKSNNPQEVKGIDLRFSEMGVIKKAATKGVVGEN